MNKLLTTNQIVQDSEYVSSGSTFFKKFDNAYQICEGQILKLETRQEYDESGDESFELMKSGKLLEAIKLLREEVNPSLKRYEDLKKRKIDFIRCRSVIFPLSDYLIWEFVAYQSNAKHGERIYCAEHSTLKNIFTKHAMHDFMIFDAKIAFVHDYDLNGKIKGGWIVTDIDKIIGLIELYSVIKANCIDFRNFIKKNKIKIPK